MYLKQPGGRLSARYAQAGDPADLNAAIAAWQDAVARTPGG